MTADPNGLPHVVPLGWTHNPAADAIDVGGRDFTRTAKFRNIDRNPNVALVVDEILPPVRPEAVRSTAMSTLTHSPLTTLPARRLQRLAAVPASIAAALVLWAIATQAAGVDLRSPAFSSTQHPAAIGAGLVAVAAALAALAAWALLAILERTIRHPRRVWTTIALAAMVVSLGAPCPATASLVQTGQCLPACTSSSPPP